MSAVPMMTLIKRLHCTMYYYYYYYYYYYCCCCCLSGECKDHMLKYMSCLKENSSDHSQCRPLAKDYLQCRMECELMTKEDWSKLGYKDIEQENNRRKQSHKQ